MKRANYKISVHPLYEQLWYSLYVPVRVPQIDALIRRNIAVEVHREIEKQIKEFLENKKWKLK